MKTKTTTILLLVFTFLFILSLNFSSANDNCQGDDVITECSLVDCNTYTIVGGADDGKCNSDGELLGCQTSGDGGYASPYSCQNTNTDETKPVNSDNTCPSGYQPSSSTPCSTYTDVLNCDAQYSCSWTPDPYCGDNNIDPTETCDDGDTIATLCDPPYGGTCDYCSSDCQTITLSGPYCGDAICDNGETYSSCSSDCEAPVSTNEITCTESGATTTLRNTVDIPEIIEEKTNTCDTNNYFYTYSCSADNTKIIYSAPYCENGCTSSGCTPDSIPTNEITCTESGATTTLTNTIDTQNNDQKTNTCDTNNYFHTYSCSADNTKINDYAPYCENGCTSSGCNSAPTDPTPNEIVPITTFNCQTTNKITTLTKTLSSVTETLDEKENKCSSDTELLSFSCEGEGIDTKIKETLASCIGGCFNSKCQEFSEEFFTEEVVTKNSVSYWSSSKDLNTEIKEVVTLDPNKIYEKSFFMVTENKKNELTFEVIAVKNLAEFSLGKFEGKLSGNKVLYEWKPTSLNFINAKEIPGQKDFIFFFKINELRSSLLKVKLENSILPSCFDNEKNGAEENVDCGGNCDLGCDEAKFCSDNKIISCSSYTNKGESYCEENPCNLYSTSSSTCYWDTNKCERKIVSESGVCYYREQVVEEDNCEDGYLLYNYDSNFEWNEGYSMEENNESIDYKNCVPVSEPVSCSLPGKKSESIISEVLASIDIEKYDIKKILKITFLVILAILIFHFSFKILKPEKKDSVEKRIKNNFIKSEKENREPKKKKIKGEVKIKTKKEKEIEKILEEFEMDI